MDDSILKVIRLALEVITGRLITILGLSMSCGLACWTMWEPIWERVTTLLIFVIFTYLVVRTKEKPRELHSEGQSN